MMDIFVLTVTGRHGEIVDLGTFYSVGEAIIEAQRQANDYDATVTPSAKLPKGTPFLTTVFVAWTDEGVTINVHRSTVF